MADTQKHSLVVTLSGDRPLEEVTSALKQSGFEVSEVLHSINVVVGTGTASAAEEMRRLPGVGDVSLDHVIDIGPPDAPVS